MKKFSLSTILIILLLALTFSANAQTTSGKISKPETWSGEIVLTGDVTISGGGRLTINPGTVVKFQPDTDDQQGGVDANLIELIIEGGEFVASGTESERITFTSEGKWYGIRNVRGALTLKYCDQNAGVIGLSVEGSVPKVVENCSFTGNSDKGALFKKSFKLVGCRLEGNATSGIYCENGIRAENCEINFNGTGIAGTGATKVDKCNITFNGGTGINITGTTTLTDCKISYNGGMGVNVNSTVTVKNCEITDNGDTGVNVSGGAELDISGHMTNTATIVDSTISTNVGAGVSVSGHATASNSGGRHNRNTVTVRNCIITQNGGVGVEVSGNAAATSWSCGHMGRSTCGNSQSCYNTITLTDCIITENSGAGISLNGNAAHSRGYHGYNYKTVTLRTCTIAENFGQGVTVNGTVIDSNWNVHNITINDCEIKENVGEGIYNKGYLSVEDSTITDNGGAGVSLIGVTGFTRNRVSGNATGVQILPDASGKIENITWNDILDNSPYELENKSNAEVIADYNYWGESTYTELKDDIKNLRKISDQLDNPDIGPVTIPYYLDKSWKEYPRPTIKGDFTLTLKTGLNMISLPLHTDESYTAKILAEKLKATLLLWFDAEAQEFVPYIPGHSEGDGFTLEGGQGYIVNLPEAVELTFTGEVWRNNAAPVLSSNEMVWAFAVAGKIISENHASDSLRVTVTNSRTGWQAVQNLSPTGGSFAVAFADMSRGAVVQTGDILEIRVSDATGHLLKTVNVPVTRTELSQARLILPPLVVHTRPTVSRLLPNFPNPFNPETWIPYTLSEASEVTIRIYDAQGRSVRSVELGYQPAGWYDTRSSAVHWDGRNDARERVSSGVYFYQITAGDFRAIRRMVIVK
ncbi:right-handed parallel beta-helix repeat-containing protein [bacterium]|nr:right-handed parallel beta-helix repeat-containing protein [bacterium]